jgi:hypothetical protein
VHRDAAAPLHVGFELHRRGRLLCPPDVRHSAGCDERHVPAVVVNVLSPAPGTARELAEETKLPVAVVEAALAELVGAGRAVEVEPERFRAR